MQTLKIVKIFAAKASWRKKKFYFRLTSWSHLHICSYIGHLLTERLAAVVCIFTDGPCLVRPFTVHKTTSLKNKPWTVQLFKRFKKLSLRICLWCFNQHCLLKSIDISVIINRALSVPLIDFLMLFHLRVFEFKCLAEL